MRQVRRLNSARMGKISSLPSSMSAVSTSLERLLNAPKFDMGPAASSAGPMLLKHESMAERFVSTEKPSSETTRKLARATRQ